MCMYTHIDTKYSSTRSTASTTSTNRTTRVRVCDCTCSTAVLLYGGKSEIGSRSCTRYDVPFCGDEHAISYPKGYVCEGARSL